jgi:hypothetical protein
MDSLDRYPIPDPGVIGRIVETSVPGVNEAVLVLPEQGKLKVLNDVGARIWSLVDGKRTIRQIAGEISTEYAISTSQAEDDARTFIDSLVQKGICRLDDHPTG